jgi:hypothetical protein
LFTTKLAAVCSSLLLFSLPGTAAGGAISTMSMALEMKIRKTDNFYLLFERDLFFLLLLLLLFVNCFDV